MRDLTVFACQRSLPTSSNLSSAVLLRERFVQWFASADELTADVTRCLKAQHVLRVPHRARLWCSLRLPQQLQITVDSEEFIWVTALAFTSSHFPSPLKHELSQTRRENSAGPERHREQAQDSLHQGNMRLKLRVKSSELITNLP